MRLVVLALVLSSTTAHADWYRGRDGKRRVTHLAVAGLGGAVYAASETIFKNTLAPSSCRICQPIDIDTDVRHALRWSNPDRAATISNLTGFVLAPAVGLGWLAIASDERSWSRWIDDAIPVIETAVVAGLINQTVKFIAAEQRPFVHFSDPTRLPNNDDNVSLFSGHATLTFAIATSAGEVARRRGYRFTPLIYGTGYALATTTAYLRIAGDKHYFTDVAIGAAFGTTIGFVIPALHRDLAISPTRTGIAIAGRF